MKCSSFVCALFSITLAFGQNSGAQGLPEEYRDAIHTLFENPAKITRSVDILEDGYVAVTTSKDSELVAVLQTHVDQLSGRLKGGRPVRRWDPAFAEFFDHYEQMTHQFTKLENGMKAKVTGKTPEAIQAAHNHAQIIMGFSARGSVEMHARHAAVTDKGKESGKGFRGGPPDSREGEPSEVFSEQAKKVSQDLVQTLGGQLKAALKSGGPVAAVSVCQSMAMPLTKATSDKHKTLTISRVTLKPRNPVNAGDAVDRRVLKHFQKLSKASQGKDGEGELPVFHLTTAADGVTERYYQPLMIAEACLKCHGSADTFAPELTDLLNKSYPKDKATGYKLGDFRGLLKVERAPVE